MAEELLLGPRIPTWERFTFLGIQWMLPDPDVVLRKMGKDVSAYRELLMDGHVRSCVSSRKAGVLTLEPRLLGESPHLDRLHEWLETIGLQSVMRNILDAPLFGFQPLQLIWENVDGVILPTKIESEPVEFFAFTAEGKLILRYMIGTNETDDLPQYRFLTVCPSPTTNNPYGDKILSSVFWHVMFKKGGFRYWVTAAEKYGMPMPVGKLPTGSTKEQVEALKTKLEAFITDGVIVISGDGTVELLKTDIQASSEIYDHLIQANDAEISKAILGQTLTTEVTGGRGSFAAGKVHQDVRRDIVDDDKRLVEATFDTILQWIYEINWPSERKNIPTFGLFKQEEVDITTLFDAGVRFNEKYFMRVHGLREEEFTVVDPGPKQIPILQPPRDNSFGEPGGAAPVRPFVGSVHSHVGTQCPICGGFSFADGNVTGAAGFPDQKAIDELPSKLDLPAQSRKLIEPVIAALRAGESFDDITKIVEKFNLSTTDFQAAMQHVCWLSEVWGRLSVGANAGLLTPAIMFDAFSLPPRDAIKFFASKGLKLSWNWNDIWRSAHNKSFTVAKVTSEDLLAKIKTEVQNAIETGATLAEFKQSLEPKLKEAGWWGKQETGSGESIQLGSPSRMELIYRTNIQTSYMAGRYNAGWENRTKQPNWQYVAVMDERTRPEHAAMNGLIYRADDPFWNSFYPPNGFNCRCRVVPLADDDAPIIGDQNAEAKDLVQSSSGELSTEKVTINQAGDTVETTSVRLPSGQVIHPDPGWDYNPGKENWGG